MSLNKLSGWERLFIVLAIIWGILCLLIPGFSIFWGLWSIMALLVFIFIWGIPLLIIYGLYKAVLWVIEGFKQK